MTLERLASLMVEGFEQLRGDTTDLKRDVKDIKRNIADIKDDLEAHGKAIDKDAVTLINHERRITKLEHTR